MEKRSQLDAFEEFILDEVNEHKMYPSGRVWDNIRTEVQGKRSWPALTIISLSVLVALTVSTFVVTQKSAPTLMARGLSKSKVITQIIDKPFTTYHSSTQITDAKPAYEMQVNKTKKELPVAVIEVDSSTIAPISNTSNDITTVIDIPSTSIDPFATVKDNFEVATIVSTSNSVSEINNSSLLPALIQQQVHTIFDITASSNTKQKKQKI